jgi:hypothetical protein
LLERGLERVDRGAWIFRQLGVVGGSQAYRVAEAPLVAFDTVLGLKGERHYLGEVARQLGQQILVA